MQAFPHLTNVQALEVTIGALTGLKPEHAALVAHARTLAHTLDVGLDRFESKTNSEYAAALKKLIEIGAPKDADEYDRLIAKLAGSGGAGAAPGTDADEKATQLAP